MKVILTDAKCREWVPDKLLKTSLSTNKAKNIAELYNSTHKDKHEWIAKVVSDEYTLWNASYVSMER